MSNSVWPHRRQPTRLPVPGILQARTLEWVAISFSNAWKWKVKGKSLSRIRLLATPWTAAYQVPWSMGFSRQEYWSGVPSPSPIVVSNFIQLCSNLCYIPFSTNLLTLTFIYLFFFLFFCDVKFGCLFETYLVSWGRLLLPWTSLWELFLLYPINFGLLHFLFFVFLKVFFISAPLIFQWHFA